MDCTPFAGSAEAWNKAVSALGVTHALQSYEWGELKREMGWEPRRFLFRENGRTVAAASVLRRRLLGGIHVLYAPKGPAYDPASAHQLPQVCAHLARIASGPCLFLKIDPDIEQDDGAALSALESCGFRPSPEQVQFRNTMLIDLRREEDDLRRRMRREVRYYLNVARRSGVQVTSGGMADLPVFYEMYRETAARDQFVVRPYRYYERAVGMFLDNGMAEVLIARHEDEPLAGIVVFVFGRRAWYIYGASRNVRREARPNHLLQWEAMLRLKARGVEVYDLWGLPNVLTPGQPMWGVVQFKKGLGGELHTWVGAWDYTPHPLLYRLYNALAPSYHAARRLLHRTGGPAAIGDT